MTTCTRCPRPALTPAPTGNELCRHHLMEAQMPFDLNETGGLISVPDGEEAPLDEQVLTVDPDSPVPGTVETTKPRRPRGTTRKGAPK